MATTQENFSLTLSSFAYGGEVLGRLPDGRAVFVPFAAPGEEVRIGLVEEKPRFARAQLLEVISPSPDRIKPLCAHYGECGGCHYQHLSYEAQLVAKQEILAEQLKRLGSVEEPAPEATIPSPEPFYYRNHVQFHLTAQGRLGYHRARSEDVLPIQECHLPERALNQVWEQLDFETIPGLERVGLRLGAGDEVQLILEGESMETPEVSVEELPVSVVLLDVGGVLVLAGGESVYDEVLGRAFRVSAGSFFQVNTPMAEAMVEHVLDGIDDRNSLNRNSLILDTYCGVGLFSAFLAEKGWRVIGIESAQSAADDFTFNLDEFEGVELYEAPVEMALGHLQEVPDVILVDPPRSGISRKAMDRLLGLGAPLLVYVSCDPATLGRDAKRLGRGGYRLEQVTPFDLFPQTYHIESVSFWVKIGARP